MSTTEVIKKQEDKEQEENTSVHDKTMEQDINKADNVSQTPHEPKHPKPAVRINFDVTKMSVDEIRSQIQLREKSRSEIIDKLKEINKNLGNAKEQRDKYNSESADAFSKVAELKEKRDATNKEIRELKTTRESVLNELKELSTRERNILESIKKYDDEKSHGKINSKAILKEIDKLDWTLQTTPNITRDEEQILMDKIDKLSSQLGLAESSEAIQRELRDIRKRKNNLKGYLDDSWKQLSEMVTASQGRHTRLTELYETGKKSKLEADKSHHTYLTYLEDANKFRDTLRTLKAELDVLYPALKDIQDKRRREEQVVKTEKATVLKNEKTIEIKKKLSSKRGLSMEEMKFMLENNLLSLKEKGEEEK